MVVIAMKNSNWIEQMSRDHIWLVLFGVWNATVNLVWLVVNVTLMRGRFQQLNCPVTKYISIFCPIALAGLQPASMRSGYLATVNKLLCHIPSCSPDHYFLLPYWLLCNLSRSVWWTVLTRLELGVVVDLYFALVNVATPAKCGASRHLPLAYAYIRSA